MARITNTGSTLPNGAKLEVMDRVLRHLELSYPSGIPPVQAEDLFAKSLKLVSEAMNEL